MFSSVLSPHGRGLASDVARIAAQICLIPRRGQALGAFAPSLGQVWEQGARDFQKPRVDLLLQHLYYGVQLEECFREQQGVLACPGEIIIMKMIIRSTAIKIKKEIKRKVDCGAIVNNDVMAEIECRVGGNAPDLQCVMHLSVNKLNVGC